MPQIFLYYIYSALPILAKIFDVISISLIKSVLFIFFLSNRFKIFYKKRPYSNSKTVLIITYNIVKAQLFVIHITIHPAMKLNISS